MKVIRNSSSLLGYSSFQMFGSAISNATHTNDRHKNAKISHVLTQKVSVFLMKFNTTRQLSNDTVMAVSMLSRDGSEYKKIMKTIIWIRQSRDEDKKNEISQAKQKGRSKERKSFFYIFPLISELTFILTTINVIRWLFLLLLLPLMMVSYERSTIPCYLLDRTRWRQFHSNEVGRMDGRRANG